MQRLRARTVFSFAVALGSVGCNANLISFTRSDETTVNSVTTGPRATTAGSGGSPTPSGPTGAGGTVTSAVAGTGGGTGGGGAPEGRGGSRGKRGRPRWGTRRGGSARSSWPAGA